MLSTMGDVELGISMIFEHGRTVNARSEVVTFDGTKVSRITFAALSQRVGQLANALRALGITGDERVGTLMFNRQEHQEAYFAIPCMGAVMHTLNFRLHPDQFTYVVNHADDRVIIFEGFLAPLLLAVRDRLPNVRTLIMVGDAPEGVAVPDEVLRYEDVLAAQSPEFDWPIIAERNAAAICYTSGTTGDPKGVVYSHRSMFLHALGFLANFEVSQDDRILAIVPMFHVNAWGLPYAAWFCGADLLMPSRFLQAEPLCRFLALESPTMSAGVPTVWSDVLRWSETHEVDFSRLKRIIVGGSAVPVSLIDNFQKRHNITIIQAWGMTETSPLGAVANAPRGTPVEAQLAYRAKTGRPMAGISLRIVDEDGKVLPNDGVAVGELEAIGPWVTSSYFQDRAPDKFHTDDRGRVWLRTGDVASIDAEWYVQITDRAKDVIKSGGEWISSVDLENALMGHPAVAEAAVVAVPDARWDERPMACIVIREGASVTPADLATFLDGKVAKWWIPERWTFIAEVPKTSTLKFDKKVLRARYAAGDLTVTSLTA